MTTKSGPAADGSVEAVDFAAPLSPQSEVSTSSESSPATGPDETPAGCRIPSLRSISDPQTTTPMTSSSTPLGMLQNARRPAPTPTMLDVRPGSSVAGGGLPQSMEAKMRAFHLSRQGTPPSRPQMNATISEGTTPSSPSFGGPMVGGRKAMGGHPAGLQLPANMRPSAHNFNSAPAVPKMPAKGGLSARRGMKLPGGLPGSPTPSSTPNVDGSAPLAQTESGSMFNQFSQYVDTKNGVLKFDGKATIDASGIKFAGGHNFNISLDEVDTIDELGKGNYGTVYKVRHARPRIRRPGMGLAGNKLLSQSSPVSPEKDDNAERSPNSAGGGGGTTGVIMAMKELRLELDDAKFRQIIMELDILHKCLSPYIIDFYGAFFQEGAVYMCIEFMDGGSIDKIYSDGMPENVLRKITYCTTQGLKTLKDDHNIIHRDVKPTNILVNTRGQVKICDFGVSGNLVASIANTNIGCQSYMAPERISGGGMSSAGANPSGGSYSVQSDIWSLGLTIIECAMGRYPYPPETYNNIFSQLSAIVDGTPPDLPEEGYSELARDFVRGCLNKIPNLRPTYSMLLSHGWLAELSKPATITEADEEEAEAGGNVDVDINLGKSGTEDEEVAAWVKNAIDRKKKGLMGVGIKPALHAAPLDTVNPASSLMR
ncbi:kinase-like domain-containing protein [Amylocarpus encephaloides]|uniref:mitogen-activated protein kinase kinase n=1 Tax=Amylocarpus encephaloides TaxID=45428 RepID=A0A9P8BZP4_9HELO|nr:kinase-like domain-containing protein [Amylocarpus encephaloides]